MFAGKTLLLYQQNLQLGPYFVKWKLAIDGGPDFSLDILQNNCSDPKS